jgi:hypothetical protein
LRAKSNGVLYTPRCKAIWRFPCISPGAKALATWSEQRFVRAVAEACGRRIMVPVINEKLKALQ